MQADYVDHRLEQWAECVKGGREGRLVSNAAVLASMIRTGVTTRSTRGPETLVDEHVEEIDRLVCALPSDLRNAINERYMQESTPEQKARACGCSVSTFWRRLAAAKKAIRIEI